MKTVRPALPWLVACICAASHVQADPMRPLIPPAPASGAPPAPAVVQASGGDRPARSREADPLKDSDRLVAIRQDQASRWQALFGERWLSVGDKLEGYTVAGIESNTVQLSEGRQRRTLHLLPPLWRPGPESAPPGATPPGAAPPGLARKSTPGSSTEVAQAAAAVLSPQRTQGLPSP